MYQGLVFPQIDPIAIHFSFLGPSVGIRWYSLSYIFGLFFAWILAKKMAKVSKSTFTVLKVDDFLVWVTIGIILGGRLGYVLFYNLKYYLEFPLNILCIWQGGMSFHGGLLGVIIATILFAKKKKVPIFAMGDILCAVAPIGLFLGRLGNFINGELYGRITTHVPWAIVFPGAGNLPRHPSQLYEALCEGLFLFIVLNVLWWFFPKFRQKQGLITGLFFILYGILRFVLEFYREPDAHIGFVVGSLSMGQILCIPMVLIGGGIVLYALGHIKTLLRMKNEK